MKSKEKTSIEILNNWYMLLKYDCRTTEEVSKQTDNEYYIIAKDLSRLGNIDKKAVGFIQFLINSISKRKLNDEQMEIMNMETGEEYGSLKEYITKKMKELFDVDIKWNI